MAKKVYKQRKGNWNEAFKAAVAVTMIVVTALFTGCGIGAGSPNMPYEPDTPAPPDHVGVFVSEHGTMVFNGDGKSVTVDFDDTLTELAGLSEGSFEGEYVFLSGPLPPGGSVDVRYDVAHELRLINGEEAVVVNVGIAAEDGSTATVGTGMVTPERIPLYFDVDGKKTTFMFTKEADNVDADKGSDDKESADDGSAVNVGGDKGSAANAGGDNSSVALDGKDIESQNGDNTSSDFDAMTAESLLFGDSADANASQNGGNKQGTSTGDGEAGNGAATGSRASTGIDVTTGSGASGNGVAGVSEGGDVPENAYTPETYAISGGKWDILQSGEIVYTMANGTSVQNAWIEDKGKYLYVDFTGCLMKNNYTADGFWVGDDGAWDRSKPQRMDDVEPVSGASYGTDPVVEIDILNFSDGANYAKAKRIYSFGHEEEYTVMPLGHSTYLFEGKNDFNSGLLAVVSEDKKILTVSGLGETVEYAMK